MVQENNGAMVQENMTKQKILDRSDMVGDG
jgi:hypothetical protein